MGLEGKMPHWVPGNCGKVECNSGEDCSCADVSDSHPVVGFSQMMRPVYSRNRLESGGMVVEAGQLPGRRVGSCKAMNGRHSADAREESTAQGRRRGGVDLRRLRSSSSYWRCCGCCCFGGCTQVQLRGIRTDVDPVVVEVIRWYGKAQSPLPCGILVQMPETYCVSKRHGARSVEMRSFRKGQPLCPR